VDTSPSAYERRGSEPDTRLRRDLVGRGLGGFRAADAKSRRALMGLYRLAISNTQRRLSLHAD
jgi:hypothetical protein